MKKSYTRLSIEMITVDNKDVLTYSVFITGDEQHFDVSESFFDFN